MTKEEWNELADQLAREIPLADQFVMSGTEWISEYQGGEVFVHHPLEEGGTTLPVSVHGQKKRALVRFKVVAMVVGFEDEEEQS